MSGRDVGNMGEKTLEFWASQVGISANKASQDKTGWDFLLEFPLARETLSGITLSLDKVPHPLKCFVQVKASDRKPGKWTVKLDNWLRLVKNPLPAFFLVLEFDSKDSCQRAFLVHIGEEYIRRVLKKLRETEVSKASELYKLYLQFTYSASDMLPTLDGRGLEQAIRRHVDGSAESYAERKIKLIETVGYEDGHSVLNISLSLPSGTDIEEYLVDFTLGLIPHIEVKHGQLTDVRFGISAPEPTEIFPEGTLLEVEKKSAGMGVIRLSTPDGKKELRIDTEVYVPQDFGFKQIDRQYHKIRLVAPFIDMIFWLFDNKNGKIDFELPEPIKQFTLKELQTIANFVLFLSEVSQKYNVIDFDIVFASKPLGHGQLNTDIAINQQTIEYATVIANAWTIAKYFDVHQEVALKPAELLRQKEQLSLMSAAISSRKAAVRMWFTSNIDLLSDSKDWCVPFISNVLIGQYHMIIASAIIGRLALTEQSTEDNNGFQAQATDVIVCRKYLYNRGETVRQTAKELIDAVAEDYGDSHNILLLGA